MSVKKKSLVRFVIASDFPYLITECFDEFSGLSFKSQADINDFRGKEKRVTGRKVRITIEEVK